MHNMSAPEIVLIITTVFTGICSVIAAIKSNKSNVASQVNSDKLDVIHNQTNGNLSEAKTKLEQMTAKYERAQRIIQELASAAPPGSLLEIKTRMDDVIDLPRQNDKD